MLRIGLKRGSETGKEDGRQDGGVDDQEENVILRAQHDFLDAGPALRMQTPAGAGEATVYPIPLRLSGDNFPVMGMCTERSGRHRVKIAAILPLLLPPAGKGKGVVHKFRCPVDPV